MRAPAFFWQKSIKPMGSSGTRYATHIGAFRGMPCRNTLYSIRHFSAPELRSISHGNLGNYTLPNLVSDSGESESMLPGRGPFPPRLFFAQNRPTRRLILSANTIQAPTLRRTQPVWQFAKMRPITGAAPGHA